MPIAGLFLVWLSVSERARNLGGTSSSCSKRFQGVREEVRKLVTFCDSYLSFFTLSGPSAIVSTASSTAALYWPSLVSRFSAGFPMCCNYQHRFPYSRRTLPLTSPIYYPSTTKQSAPDFVALGTFINHLLYP